MGAAALKPSNHIGDDRKLIVGRALVIPASPEKTNAKGKIPE